jgi:low affinity Fe/Cu permease
MMDMNGMMERCVDAMGSMMGSGTVLVVLMVLLLFWLISLGVVGALVFWGFRRLSETRAYGQRIEGWGKLTAHYSPDSSTSAF